MEQVLTLQEESLFTSLESSIDTIYDNLKLWNKYDTILALESTDDKKDGLIHKIIETIKNIIKECKRIIVKTVSSIDNHIRYGLLSKKRKEEFKKFESYIAANPAVKNKKVTVKDWQRIIREYDKVEKEILKAMNDNKVDAKGLNLKANELLSNLSSVANSATAALTVDLCMVLARKSPEMAKVVETGLNNCSAAIENIERELGSSEAMKLQKNVHKLTKESTGQRILAQLFQRKEKTIIECVEEVGSELSKLMSGDATFTDKAKAAVEHRSLIRTGAKSYVKNEGTRKGVKAILDTKKQLEHDENVQSIVKNVKEFIKPTV